MAIRTIVHVYTKDAQGYVEDNHFDVTPATFGATTLPTSAHIEAYINSVYGLPGAGNISSSIVTGYSVEVLQDNPTTAAGGDGAVATSIALKTRQEIGSGADPLGWEIRIPGADKSTYFFSPNDANSVIVVGGLWDAVRTALHNLGALLKGGSAAPTSDLIQTAVVFNGKRGARRPR